MGGVEALIPMVAIVFTFGIQLLFSGGFIPNTGKE